MIINNKDELIINNGELIKHVNKLVEASCSKLTVTMNAKRTQQLELIKGLLSETEFKDYRSFMKGVLFLELINTYTKELLISFRPEGNTDEAHADWLLTTLSSQLKNWFRQNSTNNPKEYEFEDFLFGSLLVNNTDNVWLLGETDFVYNAFYYDESKVMDYKGFLNKNKAFGSLFDRIINDDFVYDPKEFFLFIQELELAETIVNSLIMNDNYKENYRMIINSLYPEKTRLSSDEFIRLQDSFGKKFFVIEWLKQTKRATTEELKRVIQELRNTALENEEWKRKNYAELLLSELLFNSQFYKDYGFLINYYEEAEYQAELEKLLSAKVDLAFDCDYRAIINAFQLIVNSGHKECLEYFNQKLHSLTCMTIEKKGSVLRVVFDFRETSLKAVEFFDDHPLLSPTINSLHNQLNDNYELELSVIVDNDEQFFSKEESEEFWSELRTSLLSVLLEYESSSFLINESTLFKLLLISKEEQKAFVNLVDKLKTLIKHKRINTKLLKELLDGSALKLVYKAIND